MYAAIPSVMTLLSADTLRVAPIEESKPSTIGNGPECPWRALVCVGLVLCGSKAERNFAPLFPQAMRMSAAMSAVESAMASFGPCIRTTPL
jgi:hypothetical protein